MKSQTSTPVGRKLLVNLWLIKCAIAWGGLTHGINLGRELLRRQSCSLTKKARSTTLGETSAAIMSAPPRSARGVGIQSGTGGSRWGLNVETDLVSEIGLLARWHEAQLGCAGRVRTSESLVAFQLPPDAWSRLAAVVADKSGWSLRIGTYDRNSEAPQTPGEPNEFASPIFHCVSQNA